VLEKGDQRATWLCRCRAEHLVRGLQMMGTRRADLAGPGELANRHGTAWIGAARVAAEEGQRGRRQAGQCWRDVEKMKWMSRSLCRKAPRRRDAKRPSCPHCFTSEPDKTGSVTSSSPILLISSLPGPEQEPFPRRRHLCRLSTPPSPSTIAAALSPSTLPQIVRHASVVRP